MFVNSTLAALIAADLNALAAVEGLSLQWTPSVYVEGVEVATLTINLPFKGQMIKDVQLKVLKNSTKVWARLEDSTCWTEEVCRPCDGDREGLIWKLSSPWGLVDKAEAQGICFDGLIQAEILAEAERALDNILPLS